MLKSMSASKVMSNIRSVIKTYKHFRVLIVLALALLPQWVSAAPALSEPQAQQLAKQFYDSKGEWAGKFEITRFFKSRFEPVQNGSVRVHFAYEWAFVKDATRTGSDNRYFVYKQINNGWTVVEMGQHQSGKL